MITKDTQIEDIVEEHPYLVPDLAYHGIQCVACGEPIWGTIGEQAERKGVKNLDAILQSMNQVVEQRRQKIGA